MSLTRLDLPDPLTPVTATKQPSGKATSTLRRLCSRAPSTTSSRPFCRGRRSGGTSMRRRPVEREVVQADVDEEPEPGVDLFQHPGTDQLLAVVELEPAKPLVRVADGQ